jgi:hypothetical protein
VKEVAQFDGGCAEDHLFAGKAAAVDVFVQHVDGRETVDGGCADAEIDQELAAEFRRAVTKEHRHRKRRLAGDEVARRDLPDESVPIREHVDRAQPGIIRKTRQGPIVDDPLVGRVAAELLAESRQDHGSSGATQGVFEDAVLLVGRG